MHLILKKNLFPADKFHMKYKSVKTSVKMIFTALAATAALTLGCMESRIQSVTTDSPYSDAVKPVLVLKNEHFGGGYTIAGKAKRTYFAGGEIFNYGGMPAYSPTIRVRIYGANGGAYDDHMISMADIFPAKSVIFDETIEVIDNYKGSEITLTYQDESRVNTMVLKPNGENITNLDKNSY